MWTKISELQDLQQHLPVFSDQIRQLLIKIDLADCPYVADHISVRCYDQQTAQRWLKGLQQVGRQISAKEINGRMIYLFALHQPLKVACWQIDCIELPFPGSKIYSQESWEHIEIVIPGEVEEFGQQIQQLLPESHTLSQRGLTVKYSQPKGRDEKLPNPTVAISDGSITIKFHPYSIKEIIESEKLSCC